LSLFLIKIIPNNEVVTTAATATPELSRPLDPAAADAEGLGRLEAAGLGDREGRVLG
jgi:hypothetical protein